MKVIKVSDCGDCPFYERFMGRENVYHTCHENQRTVKGDFKILLGGSMKIIEVNDCQDCPYYERFQGKEHIYHTCHYNNRTTKGNFELLLNYCELNEV